MQEEKTPKRALQVKVDVDTSTLDIAIEKANRLVELLREASNIIDSLRCPHFSAEELIDSVIRHSGA